MDYLQYLADGITAAAATLNVLNLIINGLPSILNGGEEKMTKKIDWSFKPYYKWITFNTGTIENPSDFSSMVLNLIINGLPSILLGLIRGDFDGDSFKPYYKWITFNTKRTPK